MGRQILDERAQVLFLCMYHLYAHPHRPLGVRERYFQMLHEMPVTELRGKGGQSRSKMSSLCHIYCALLSSASLSQTMSDPAVTDRFNDRWQKHREPQKIWGLLCTSCVKQLMIPALRTEGPFCPFQREHFFLFFLNSLWLFWRLPSNRVHVPRIPPRCVSRAPAAVPALPALLTANFRLTFCPMLSLGLIIYFYWILEKTTIEESGF